jgi:homoserine kinase
MKRQATARAPSGVGNVGVGFDILGHSFAGPHDEVSVRRVDDPGVRIVAIRGSERPLPMAAADNTAGAALLSLCAAVDLKHGFEVEIDKGIPYGSGLGGSAASGVAALVAANALLDAPLTREQLYPHAVTGEAVASGARHGDNVGAMLLGGLVLATADRLVRLTVPDWLHVAVVHPHFVLETRRAREVLVEPYALSSFVEQSAHLSLLLAGCQRGDAELLRAGLTDVLVEPRRAPLIPGFAAVKQAALQAGALGGSISGAGPSVFAWCEGAASADDVRAAMRAAFAQHGYASDGWAAPVAGPRAEVTACVS